MISLGCGPRSTHVPLRHARLRLPISPLRVRRHRTAAPTRSGRTPRRSHGPTHRRPASHRRTRSGGQSCTAGRVGFKRGALSRAAEEPAALRASMSLSRSARLSARGPAVGRARLQSSSRATSRGSNAESAARASTTDTAADVTELAGVTELLFGAQADRSESLRPRARGCGESR